MKKLEVFCFVEKVSQKWRWYMHFRDKILLLPLPRKTLI